jgi:molybdate transport system substrate-binding protein
MGKRSLKMAAARADRRHFGACCAILAAGLFLGAVVHARASQAPVTETRVVVTAAASTLQALDAAIAIYKHGNALPHRNIRIVPIYASSGALARQIIAQGPAEIFISANSHWMDAVTKAQRAFPDTRQTLMANSLVLAAPRQSKLQVSLKPGVDLLGALDGGRLVTADPAHAPLGSYAKAGLQWLGAWEAIKNRLIRVTDAARARTLVEQGAVAAGILYASDVAANPRLKSIAAFPQESHPPAVYEIALLGSTAPTLLGSTSQAARDFAGWLSGQEGQKIFARHGFIPAAKIKVPKAKSMEL